jgi:hypothetical protein
VLQEREETDRVYTFLAALDPSYEAVRAQVLLSTEKLTFDDVIALIRQEATRPSSSCAPTPEEARQRGRSRGVLIAKRKDTHPTNAGYYTLISDLGEMIATRKAAHIEEKP